jgi:prokaryotic ubiquitin-like protein Pup
MAAATETTRKGKRAPSPEPGERENTSGSLAKRGAALRKNIDDVLADIDDILEENAEEFVKDFVQRGGE